MMCLSMEIMPNSVYLNPDLLCQLQYLRLTTFLTFFFFLCWVFVGALQQLSMHACIGEGNGNPLQYPCPENPRDGGAWWAAVYGVAQSDMIEAT